MRIVRFISPVQQAFFFFLSGDFLPTRRRHSATTFLPFVARLEQVNDRENEGITRDVVENKRALSDILSPTP
jgi:hypothetical protein